MEQYNAQDVPLFNAFISLYCEFENLNTNELYGFRKQQNRWLDRANSIEFLKSRIPGIATIYCFINAVI